VYRDVVAATVERRVAVKRVANMLQGCVVVRWHTGRNDASNSLARFEAL
jgi:hypothetical protein